MLGTAFLALIFVVVWLNAFSATVVLPLGRGTTPAGHRKYVCQPGRPFLFQSHVRGRVALTVARVAFDPLLKAYYTLRIFYGRALRTGEDLRLDLRLARIGVRVLLVIGLCAGAGARAAAPAGVTPVAVGQLRPGNRRGARPAGIRVGPPRRGRDCCADGADRPIL